MGSFGLFGHYPETWVFPANCSGKLKTREQLSPENDRLLPVPAQGTLLNCTFDFHFNFCTSGYGLSVQLI
jgi:hypothetical protein